MDVSPKTIREVEFREKLRGYNPDEVDEFLERVAAGLEILQERLRQATERAVRAEQRATEVGEGDDAMRRTLVLAQRTADAAVQEAREQASQIVAHAEAQAQAVRSEAAEHARRTIEDATRDAWAQVGRLEAARDELRAEIASLQRYLEGERARVRAALHEAIRRVDETLPSVGEPPPAVALDMARPAPPAAAAPPVRHDVDPGPPTMEVSDDEFFAELRMAVGDTSPLGPREEGNGTGVPQSY
ncbi:MAG TPA: DivIVA domain-containing protein [Acidimicrobiales bacterium]|nr:DivIVA domain-containing protein [Acidimicrobiales bacterium]